MKLREMASGIVLIFMVFSWFCMATNNKTHDAPVDKPSIAKTVKINGK